MRTSKSTNKRSDTRMSGLWENSETMGTEREYVTDNDYILSEYEARSYVEAIEMGVIED